MEGYGALGGNQHSKVDAIVIRSVSDNVADKAESGKGWQPGSPNTTPARFAFELLANYQVGWAVHAAGPAGPIASSNTDGARPVPAEAGELVSLQSANAASIFTDQRPATDLKPPRLPSSLGHRFGEENGFFGQNSDQSAIGLPKTRIRRPCFWEILGVGNPPRSLSWAANSGMTA